MVCKYCNNKLEFNPETNDYVFVKDQEIGTLDFESYWCPARSITFQEWINSAVDTKILDALKPHEPLNQTDILKALKRCLK